MTNYKNRILIIDDEIKICQVIKSYLESESFQVFEANTGKEALRIYEEVKPNLIILDLMLPDITGEQICKKIRETSKVPIIMLTAKVEENNILEGLNIGADDYITKPFSPKQLVARVQAVLRRTKEDVLVEPNNIIFVNGKFNIDIGNHEVIKDGKALNLTPNEYKICLTLAKYPKKTFTREELISIALGEKFEGFDRTIDVHIKNLRQKLEDDHKNPMYIKTVRGIGYKWGGEI